LASQGERRAATRSALIDAARNCFVEHGFEATTTAAVLARAGVSKGALYHHFATKAELFIAVFEEVTRAMVAKANLEAAAARSPRKMLVEALKGWLRVAVDEPVSRRIVLEMGPESLGLQRARQIEEAITQPPIQRAIQAAVARGEVRCPDVPLVARLLSAMVAELALVAIDRKMTGSSLSTFDPVIDGAVSALMPSK
jgi:AcrR family transcriptional regulator